PVHEAERLVQGRVAEIQRSCRSIELGGERIDEILDDQLVPADAPLRLKEDVPSGFVDIDVDEEHRLFGTVEDQAIGRLWCSDRVVVDLLVAEDILER